MNKEELKMLKKRLKEKGVELVPVEKLKPHEEIVSKDKIAELKISIMTEGVQFPIVCDKKTGIILDGHTRYEILKELKLKTIPVYYIDYFDDDLVLETWRATRPLKKEDIVKAVEHGWIFPYKTTKHMYRTKEGLVHISKITPKVDVPLEALMMDSDDK